MVMMDINEIIYKKCCSRCSVCIYCSCLCGCGGGSGITGSFMYQYVICRRVVRMCIGQVLVRLQQQERGRNG
jgi:hypothetical protein